jgi:hypothetical protein
MRATTGEHMPTEKQKEPNDSAELRLLKQFLASFLDVRDQLLVLRSALYGVSLMPQDHALLTGMSLYKLADQMAGAALEREQSLIAALREVERTQADQFDTIH